MDLRPNKGSRHGTARLNSLNKKCEYCWNCIPYINNTCSGHKRNITDCSEFIPDKPVPKRYKDYDLMSDEEITS